MTDTPRYTVTESVGEGNNIAYVVDNYGPNDTDWEIAESFSTRQDGANWRDKANARCAELNARHALRLAGRGLARPAPIPPAPGPWRGATLEEEDGQ